MNKDENLRAQRTTFSNSKRFDNTAFEAHTQNYEMNGTWKVGFILFNWALDLVSGLNFKLGWAME